MKGNKSCETENSQLFMRWCTCLIVFFFISEIFFVFNGSWKQFYCLTKEFHVFWIKCTHCWNKHTTFRCEVLSIMCVCVRVCFLVSGWGYFATKKVIMLGFDVFCMLLRVLCVKNCLFYYSKQMKSANLCLIWLATLLDRIGSYHKPLHLVSGANGTFFFTAENWKFYKNKWKRFVLALQNKIYNR